MKLGSKIKSLRIEKNFSTDFMAEKLGISEQTYRKYESDKNSPDLNLLENIANVLGKNFIDLLPENILFNNNDPKGGLAVAQNLDTINKLSAKLIEQYEERTQEFKQMLADLKGK
jgi:transcriptional regulator with XRE-family HTH domain